LKSGLNDICDPIHPFSELLFIHSFIVYYARSSTEQTQKNANTYKNSHKNNKTMVVKMMKNTTIKAIIASKMNLRTGAPSRILMGELTALP